MGNVQEALYLANTATALDTAGNFSGAYGKTDREFMHCVAVPALVRRISLVPS